MMNESIEQWAERVAPEHDWGAHDRLFHPSNGEEANDDDVRSMERAGLVSTNRRQPAHHGGIAWGVTDVRRVDALEAIREG